MIPNDNHRQELYHVTPKSHSGEATALPEAILPTSQCTLVTWNQVNDHLKVANSQATKIEEVDAMI